jgi:hypothetical protein
MHLSFIVGKSKLIAKEIMDHPEIVPNRYRTISTVICYHCGLDYESEGWCEGSWFDPDLRCPRCGKEQG